MAQRRQTNREEGHAEQHDELLVVAIAQHAEGDLAADRGPEEGADQ